MFDARTETLSNETSYFTIFDIHRVDIDFGCINIQKQPSIKHPLLKNHKIQLYPTFTRNIVQKRPSYDLMMSITLDTNQTTTFHGGYAYVGAYNLQLKGKQYSLSGILVESGQPSNLNSIFDGIRVMPNLYRDSEIYLTSHVSSIGSFKKWVVVPTIKQACYIGSVFIESWQKHQELAAVEATSISMAA
ncbi:uncharacterized protein LOC127101703 [Lathyrus oleraceus]|uniref:uncharacterized protein LOC127101703 n=1 Tax=Pisum sativum TaxID=3888 RepID=UPI0021D29576|nr:uncharacterized protein LOC127101703 [Pisum sativum]